MYISLEEQQQNYAFISRKSSVYDAKEGFENQGQQIDAMLITENGKKSEKLMGIITSWDVLNLS